MNGRQITQEAQFVRAAQSQFFSRHNRSVTLTFTVQRGFTSVEDAELFFLGYYTLLSDGPATLLCVCGTENVLIQNAVLEGISEPRYIGESVDVTYTFRIPKIVTTWTEEDEFDDESQFNSGSLAIT